jgi:choline monooxygenase
MNETAKSFVSSTGELIVGADVLEGLERPTGEAKGLPGRVYYTDEAFQAERANVFAPSWIPVAFTSDAPNAGDVFPVSVAGWELLFVRGEDGVLRGFHNLCRHRGVKLVREAGNARTIVCSYHCWGYDLTGGLKTTPNISGVGANQQPEMDKSELALVGVRTAIWHDLVFVNIDGTAGELDAHMQPVLERLERYDLSLLRPSQQGRGAMDINANWKIFIEAGIEDYHLPFIHKQTLVSYAKNYRAEDGGEVYAGFSQAHTASEAKKRHRNGLGDNHAQLPNHPVVEADDRAEFIAVFLFPLGNVILSPSGLTLGLTLPRGPAFTQTRTRTYFIGEAATDDDHRAVRKSRAEFFTKVIAEDIEVMESVQSMAPLRETLGLQTRFSGYWEQSLHSFQRYYARRMAAKAIARPILGRR